ncbi:MAG TPA: hypothetical protein VFO29_01650 [Candidatus Rubrimentiphilum sp.]|nr:hypothetical protein [Candidatus Rubrimentiphilum sp.]
MREPLRGPKMLFSKIVIFRTTVGHAEKHVTLCLSRRSTFGCRVIDQESDRSGKFFLGIDTRTPQHSLIGQAGNSIRVKNGCRDSELSRSVRSAHLFQPIARS